MPFSGDRRRSNTSPVFLCSLPVASILGVASELQRLDHFQALDAGGIHHQAHQLACLLPGIVDMPDHVDVVDAFAPAVAVFVFGQRQRLE